MTSTETVRCRPPRSYWTFVFIPALYGFLSAMVAFAPAPKGTSSPFQTAVFAALFLSCILGALLGVWWLLRAGITGDSGGLRSRGMGGWKSVRWDEVTDYYEKLRPQDRSRDREGRVTAVSVVEGAGYKLSITDLWSNAEALRCLVEQNALQSCVLHWEIKGTRLVDPWPRVFDYDTRENRWMPRIWLKLFLLYLVYLIIKPALQLAASAGSIGWAIALIGGGLYVLLIGSIGLIFLVPLAQYRAANRRKTERITADLNGITFEDGLRCLEASWPAVSDAHIDFNHSVFGRYIVKTEQGDFDFLPSLSNAVLLQAIIQRHALRLGGNPWSAQNNREVLGGEALRWSGGKAGSGARIFHYQTRMNRALLWMPLMVGFICGLEAVLAQQGLLPGMKSLTPSLSGAGSFLVLFLGWHAYKRSNIALDKNGLTQRTLFGSRYLLWEQVQDYRADTEGGGRIVGHTQTIRFSSLIVGRDELKAEVSRHAAGCGGSWEMPTRTSQDDRRRGRRGLR